MESYHAIHVLMETHNIDIDSYGNCKFRAVVEYCSSAKNATVATDVSIARNGYNDGVVRLGEVNTLSANDFHLDFSPDNQQYRFGKNKTTLVITGNSQKMGGTYSVSILPISSSI